MSESSKPAGPAPDLKQSIERLDALLASETVEEKIRAGMGIRLALGMAQELKSGKPLGAETAELVADWAAHYGQDTVDAAVKTAREFLVKPEAMRSALGQKLGLEKGDETGNRDEDGADSDRIPEDAEGGESGDIGSNDIGSSDIGSKDGGSKE